MSDYFEQLFNQQGTAGQMDSRVDHVNAFLSDWQENSNHNAQQMLASQQGPSAQQPIPQSTAMGPQPDPTQQLSDEQQTTEAASMVNSGAPTDVKQDYLVNAAANYGKPDAPNMANARAGLINRLSLGEPDPSRIPLVQKTATQVSDATNANVQSALTQVHLWVNQQTEQFESENKDLGQGVVNELGEAKNMGLSTGNAQAIQQAGKLVGDTLAGGRTLIDSFNATMLPGVNMAVGDILSKHVPDFNWTEYLTPGRGIKYIQDLIRNQPPSISGPMVKDILSEIGNQGYKWNDDAYAKTRIVQTIFSGLEDPDVHGMAAKNAEAAAAAYGQQGLGSKIVGALRAPFAAALGDTDEGAVAGQYLRNKLAAVLTSPTTDAVGELLNWVPFVGAGFRALKEGVTGGMAAYTAVKFNPGTIALDLSDLYAGAKKMDQAATGQARGLDPMTATAQLGTTPGQVMGELLLPKPHVVAVTETAPSSQVIQLDSAVLPRNLAGASPRYQNAPLAFNSDVDKALYIVAGSNKSKADSAYRGWLTEKLGMSQTEIDTRAADVKAHVQSSVNSPDLFNPENGSVTIPARSTGSYTVGGEPQTVARFRPIEAGEPPADLKPATQVQTSVGPVTIDSSKTVPYLGGSNGKGTVYLNKGFNPVKFIQGKWVDTTPFLAEHEAVEAKLEGQGMSYTDAHAQATDAENAAVRKAGIAPKLYNDAMKSDLHVAARSKGATPSDLIEKPYGHPDNALERTMQKEVIKGDGGSKGPQEPQGASVGPQVNDSPDGKPWLEQMYLPEAERLRQQNDAVDNAKALFTNKLNDWQVIANRDTKSFDLLQRIGNMHGTGWTASGDAATWAQQNLKGAYNVVQDKTGAFQVEYTSRIPYTVDNKSQFAPQLLKVKPLFMFPGGSLAATAKFPFFAIGKTAVFADEFAAGSTHAVAVTERMDAHLRHMAEPFFKLRGESSVKVQHTVLRGEADRVSRYTDYDLDKFNLTKEEKEGYHAYRDVVAHDLIIRNSSTRAKAIMDGWREVKVGGNPQMVREAPAEVAGRMIQKNTRALDIATGKPVELSTLQAGTFKIMQLMDDERGEVAGILRNKQNVDMKMPPQQFLKDIPGFVPRYYNQSWFVKERLPDGRLVAYKTARSSAAAQREVDAMKAADPKRSFEAIQSSRVADASGTWDELARMREQGMLYTSHRKPDALMDVDGIEARLDPVHSLDTMIRSAAMQEGLGHWALANKSMWDNTFGRKYGISMDLNHEPTRPPNSQKGNADFDQALAAYDYIRMTMGLHEGQGAWVRNLRNKAADLFYNGADAVRQATKGSTVQPLGSAVSRVPMWFGDHISGMKPTAVALMKNLTFIKAIALNPIVHLPMQMSMIPTYIGVDHALGYTMSGGMLKDMLTLVMHDTNLGGALAKFTGKTSGEQAALLRDYQVTGLSQLADHHLMVAGIMGASDKPIGLNNAFLEGTSRVVRLMSSIGFKPGVKMDKMAAWLVMRNRAIQRGADLRDPNVLNNIAADAEHLTGSVNRSDQVIDPQAEEGVLSAVMQFHSHPLKMFQRAIQGLGMGYLGKEASLSSAEQAKIGVASLLTYGVGGYGLEKYVEQQNSKHGWGLPRDVITAIQEGLVGSLANATFHAFDDEGQETKVVFSDQFSPFFMVGRVVDTVAHMARGLYYMRGGSWEDFASAASLGFSGQLAHAVDNVRRITFTSPAPAPEKAVAAAGELFRLLPVDNQALRAYMGMKYGQMVDSRGDPLVEASKGEAVAALFGVKSYREIGTEDLSKYMYGDEKSETYPGEQIDTGLTDYVNKTWNWLEPQLRIACSSGNQLDIDRCLTMMDRYSDAMQGGLTKSQWYFVRDTLANRIMQADIPKDERLAKVLMQNLDSPKNPPPDKSFYNHIAGMDFKNKDEVLESIKQWWDDPAGGDTMENR